MYKRQGERSEEQEQWQDVLGEQLEIGLQDVDKNMVAIAYEPVWLSLIHI